MAKKVDKPETPKGEDDLEVLHPERTITIQGEQITAREYGFVEGLRLRPIAAPFLEALHQLMGSGQGLSLEQVMDAIAAHHEVTLELIAASIDRDVEWLHTLNDRDGYLVLMSWWGACGPFLLRSVQQRRLAEMVAARVNQKPASAGATSTAPSSPTDTTQPASATTQSGS